MAFPDKITHAHNNRRESLTFAEKL